MFEGRVRPGTVMAVPVIIVEVGRGSPVKTRLLDEIVRIEREWGLGGLQRSVKITPRT
jgi:hypothetical protein